jgi:hypothetical protein
MQATTPSDNILSRPRRSTEETPRQRRGSLGAHLAITTSGLPARLTAISW